MESLNLEAVQKRHNCIGEYCLFVDAWRHADVVTIAGYIIGFPFDTADCVERDIIQLKKDVRPDVASFFMVTPPAGLVSALIRRWTLP